MPLLKRRPPDKMWLIVGLGNPGGSYARNRHNIGFMAADEIVRRHCFSPWRSKYQGQIAEGTIAGEKVLVLKPETYMNLSGQSVAAAARFHKIPNGNVIALHDEIDLPPGKVRVKKGGGAAGHNGLKSIDAHLGNDYWRVRLGIGHPGDKDTGDRLCAAISPRPTRTGWSRCWTPWRTNCRC